MPTFNLSDVNNNYSAITLLLLTTASLCGGWVPGLSRGFHFWQPAPRLNNAPWLAQLHNPAMSPNAKERAPVTLAGQSKKLKEGGGTKQLHFKILVTQHWQRNLKLPQTHTHTKCTKLRTTVHVPHPADC